MFKSLKLSHKIVWFIYNHSCVFLNDEQEMRRGAPEYTMVRLPNGCRFVQVFFIWLLSILKLNSEQNYGGIMPTCSSSF